MSSSSVIVVEIDTRKGPLHSLFDSSIEAQSEQARQFWKTLKLPPHIESSLYSKEISQQLKTNKLQPMCKFGVSIYLKIELRNFYFKAIDNSRKPLPPDPSIILN